MTDQSKGGCGTWVLPGIGVVVALLFVSQCGRERSSYAELEARAQRQVDAEERIAEAEGRPLEEEPEEYPWRP